MEEEEEEKEEEEEEKAIVRSAPDGSDNYESQLSCGRVKQFGIFRSISRVQPPHYSTLHPRQANTRTKKRLKPVFDFHRLYQHITNTLPLFIWQTPNMLSFWSVPILICKVCKHALLDPLGTSLTLKSSLNFFCEFLSNCEEFCWNFSKTVNSFVEILNTVLIFVNTPALSVSTRNTFCLATSLFNASVFPDLPQPR